MKTQLVALYRRFGNPIEWCTADRCLLAALVCLVSLVMYTIAGLYYLANPDIAEYVHLPTARLFLSYTVLLEIGWSAIAVAALLLRSRSPENQVLVLVTCLFYGIGFGISAYLFGNVTCMHTGVVTLAGWTFGLVLFPRKYVIWGTTALVLVILATTVADQVGWLPYGPLMTSAPYKDGRISGLFLVTIGGITGNLVLVVIILIDFIIQSWKRQQAKTVELADQLSTANEIISHYVAEQLAQKIRDGEHDEASTPTRRRLTLVFSDIAEFSVTADELEPEDLSRLLNEYLAAMTGIAEKYGATIDKFVGDAVICFFGAPNATNDRDQALRAVRMAMEMNRRVAELDPSWRKLGARRSLRIRIGVNTGLANVGSFGSTRRKDYTAIGRQVNLTARLEASCKPGNVLISQSSYELVCDQISCLPMGEIQVKGIHHPVRVYSPVEQAKDNGVSPE
ncbi:MAG: adenylate/guanylate cyclase domain-containing protein [Syntrophobacteraceae bacterium]